LKIKTIMKLLLSVVCSLFLNTISADEMLFKFKSPSFSGNGTSAHYLTIENQEHSREKKIKEEIQAYKEELVRDQNNTTLARFIRNLESRIYAELSRQLVDNMFGETKSESGSFTLEGNKVDYSTDGSFVSLKITDTEGGETTITVPIGSFTF
jgi:hypothetical protein